MQGIRRYVAVVSLFAVLGLSGSAIAAPQKGSGARVWNAQSQLHKLKGLIVKILDDLENKLSLPPG
jgi:hypothetical protein